MGVGGGEVVGQGEGGGGGEGGSGGRGGGRRGDGRGVGERRWVGRGGGLFRQDLFGDLFEENDFSLNVSGIFDSLNLDGSVLGDMTTGTEPGWKKNHVESPMVFCLSPPGTRDSTR